MKVAVFSTKPYDREFLAAANDQFSHDLCFFEPRLTPETVRLAAGYEGICTFVNDELTGAVLETLADSGLRVVALRCAGFNNVDLEACDRLGITVVRVPAYSPHAVAEHTIGLMLALNRKLHRAYGRVREGNFSLDGLLGFDLHGRTAGVIGTGQIGAIVAQLLVAFGCRVLAFDVAANPECTESGVEYVPLDDLYRSADIITLHCPLVPQTHHLIDGPAIEIMKDNVMLINTSRGGIIDTAAVIGGLKSGRIGWLGIDVYEEETELFFEDLSNEVLRDDTFARLLTFPNVIVTGHQAFFTRDALEEIAQTTLSNLRDLDAGRPCPNQVSAPAHKRKRARS